MRWQNRRESNNVEDRRGQSSGNFSGGNFFIPRGKSGIVLLIIVLVAGYYGVDLTPLLGGGGNGVVQTQSAQLNTEQDNEMAKFTSVTLASTEDIWSKIFQQDNKVYQDPKLVLFRGATPTACGTGQSAMGPFYCPPDRTVYIDLSFYQDMKNKLGADGDFAQAYVIAHEVGHHVQNLLGIADQVRALQQQSRSQAEVNRLSVKLELQADCFAGVWGYHANLDQILEPGDLEEALNAARAIGDDRLQKQGQGYVVPDSFTHGTSEQRYTWFKRGFDSGKITSCNTFSAA
jgi:predicted metalloprotease